MNKALTLISFAFTIKSGVAQENSAVARDTSPPSISRHRVVPALSVEPLCRSVNINPRPNCTPPPRTGLELRWMTQGERRIGMASLHAWSRQHAYDGVLAVFADPLADKAVVLTNDALPTLLWLQSELDGVATIPVELRPLCLRSRKLESLREELVTMVRNSRPGLAMFAAEIDLRFGGIRVLLPYGEETLGTWIEVYFGDEVLIHYREPLPKWFTKARKSAKNARTKKPDQR